MEMIIEAIGGTPVHYAGKHKCCGFPVITMARTTSLRQAGRHIADAIDADADCMVTPCPLCHLNLDMQQIDASKYVERELGLPILHFPQMLGLALGIEPKELGMNRHVVRTKDVQAKIAELAAA
jgi:succinate dehydrogenase / fumarate reductase cytochrome b subunit